MFRCHLSGTFLGSRNAPLGYLASLVNFVCAFMALGVQLHASVRMLLLLPWEPSFWFRLTNPFADNKIPAKCAH
jgi:hypothetical protein